MKDLAFERLRGALPHMRLAIEMAQQEEPDGTVQLAIIAINPDGSGKMTAAFDYHDFFNDLAEILGLTTESVQPPDTV